MRTRCHLGLLALGRPLLCHAAERKRRRPSTMQPHSPAMTIVSFGMIRMMMCAAHVARAPLVVMMFEVTQVQLPRMIAIHLAMWMTDSNSGWPPLLLAPLVVALYVQLPSWVAPSLPLIKAPSSKRSLSIPWGWRGCLVVVTARRRWVVDMLRSMESLAVGGAQMRTHLQGGWRAFGAVGKAMRISDRPFRRVLSVGTVRSIRMDMSDPPGVRDGSKSVGEITESAPPTTLWRLEALLSLMLAAQWVETVRCQWMWGALVVCTTKTWCTSPRSMVGVGMMGL